MIVKDWVLLLVPIFCNGIVVFILQKIFDKRQFIKTIKYDYASILRQKIDISLELHANVTRLANEDPRKNSERIEVYTQKYVNSVLDVYYYHFQNKKVFKSFDNQIERVAKLILELGNCIHQKEIDFKKFSDIFNEIRDVLLVLKYNCINLNF